MSETGKRTHFSVSMPTVSANSQPPMVVFEASTRAGYGISLISRGSVAVPDDEFADLVDRFVSTIWAERRARLADLKVEADRQLDAALALRQVVQGAAE